MGQFNHYFWKAVRRTVLQTVEVRMYLCSVQRILSKCENIQSLVPCVFAVPACRLLHNSVQCACLLLKYWTKWRLRVLWWLRSVHQVLKPYILLFSWLSPTSSDAVYIRTYVCMCITIGNRQCPCKAVFVWGSNLSFNCEMIWWKVNGQSSVIKHFGCFMIYAL